MLDRILLPPDFLPLIDDAPRLLVLADYVEEHPSSAGNLSAEQHAYLLKLLRSTAKLWASTPCVGIPRRLVGGGMEVWARYSSQGWSRAETTRVTDRRIWVEFPYRPLHPSGVQRAERAWWDVEPRGDWQEKHWPKPSPRIGYGTGVNAMLAAALTLDQRPKVATVGAEQPSLFTEDLDQ